MDSILIKNANIVNEGKQFSGDVWIKDGLIQKIDSKINSRGKIREINAEGKLLLPGVIDDQVHFREPGLTHKGSIYTESRAAAAGGVTSFMEMPNTNPQTVTQELLRQKYDLAVENSLTNYSFYMGATNENLEEVLKTDKRNVCGIKVFMGSSTGNMLVDDEKTLEKLFGSVDMLIATHCEDESTIKTNMEAYKEKYGDDVPISCHPDIRSREACKISSSKAVSLAKKCGAKLHVLHISTADELELFENHIPLEQKRITAEVCIHHLWFERKDYEDKGALIKWNPAVKEASDKKALLEALITGKLDVVATDHAPHTLQEKQNNYFAAPSGGPLIQHSLVAMLELARNGKISLGQVVEKMCHNPAILYQIDKRGFIREGYWADLVLVDPQALWTVTRGNLLYKCMWSPFEGQQFHNKVTHTIVSGNIVYEHNLLIEKDSGKRLQFNR